MRRKTCLKFITICAVVVFFGLNYAMAGTWNTIDMPGVTTMYPWGISGGNIVGTYGDASNIAHGFIYDGTIWNTLDMPGASSTAPSRIDGINITGSYYASGRHSFLYNGTTWTTLDMPGKSNTIAYGIDGSNIVGYYGYYSDYHGFLYNGATWTTLDMPGAKSTIPCGIDGSNIVGTYYDASGASHGFIYTIPEPATLLLLGLGGLILRRRRA